MAHGTALPGHFDIDLTVFSLSKYSKVLREFIFPPSN